MISLIINEISNIHCSSLFVSCLHIPSMLVWVFTPYGFIVIGRLWKLVILIINEKKNVFLVVFLVTSLIV